MPLMEDSGISGWETYYLFVLSAALALFIPLFLFLISRVFARLGRGRLPSSSRGAAVRARESDSASTSRESDSASTAGIPSLRVNTRFFLGVNVALLVTAAALVLIPCVELFQATKSTGEKDRLLAVAASVIVVALFAGLGLLYAIRKKDLDWMRT